ncbi:MAG: NAD(P)/FAD-dependent oxidoreductase [Halieaceae bacterium]|jgi:cation diffusion facilitator CzcD-associated flavoprotein CzcO|nr:NAD(P)/FAD-dependent oxidoreductase [Halieaceae bacterium]
MKRYPVIILGAGMSGICMGIKLRDAGITDFLILEKTDAAGGTWHDNTYPGACCDVASHLYSFSFEPKPDWSRAYAPQPEIQAYFEHCIDKYRLRECIRYGATVEAAELDESQGEWQLRLADGERLACRFLVSGLGQLNRPNIPDFPGLDSFRGASFHSARWDHSVSLAGKRVAVIGNAASAIQFIPPVAREAAQVTVYQRSANYLVPRNDRAYSAAEIDRFRRFPWLQKLSRLAWYLRQELFFFGAMLPGSLRHRLVKWIARRYLEQEISDPSLRQVLTPDYPLGCKRILVSDDYYQALAAGGIEVVTSPIEGIGPDGVISADGVERPVDVIIFGTGFKATEFLAPLEIRGRGGERLSDCWRDGAWAHRGVAVPGFPNLFMLYGPNTNLGHNSIIYMVEAQVRYVVRCIDKMLAHDIRLLDANREVAARFNEKLQADLEDTVWGGECGSWYKNASGKITNNWPHSSLRFHFSMQRPDFSEFDMSA